MKEAEGTSNKEAQNECTELVPLERKEEGLEIKLDTISKQMETLEGAIRELTVRLAHDTPLKRVKPLETVAMIDTTSMGALPEVLPEALPEPPKIGDYVQSTALMNAKRELPGSLGVKDIMNDLDVARRTVMYWIYEGDLPVHKINNRLLVASDDYEAFKAKYLEKEAEKKEDREPAKDTTTLREAVGTEDESEDT